MSFSFDKMLPADITAYKNNIQTRGDLGQVCATRMYPSIERVEFAKSLKLYTMHNNNNEHYALFWTKTFGEQLWYLR